MRSLPRLFLLFSVVMALVWVFRAPIQDRLGLVAGTPAGHTGSEARGGSGAAERTAGTRLADLDFSVETITRELRATGRVVRRKVAEAGRQLEESTRDARTTAHIDTKDGLVTLKGLVDSHEEVARAIRMAVEEDDVLEVTSTLQVSAGGAAAERLSGVAPEPQPIRRAQATATPVP
jgi:hypothetical protein